MQPTSFLRCTEGEKVGVWVKIFYKNWMLLDHISGIINLKNDEYSYVEIPSELVEANKIEIILTIRGIKYTLVLK